MINLINQPTPRNDFILLVDFQFNGIVCSAENATIASATAMAYTNMSYINFPTYTEHIDPLHINGKFDNLLHHYYTPNTWAISELSPDKITNEWINFRKEVIERKKAHDNLDRICRSACVKSNDNFFIDNNIAYLTDQLNLCDVDKNLFTDAIIFYGSITECDSLTAYNELKMLVNSTGQRNHRILSLYMKYRTKINLADINEFENIFKSLRKELYENSWV